MLWCISTPAHWCHNLMGNLFRLLRRNVKDKKCFKIVQTNGERNTKLNASECSAQNISVFAFAFDNTSTPFFYFVRFMDDLFKPCERLKLPVVIKNLKNCRRQKLPDCLSWISWKLIYTCLCYSEGIYLMRVLNQQWWCSLFRYT